MPSNLSATGRTGAPAARMTVSQSGLRRRAKPGAAASLTLPAAPVEKRIHRIASTYRPASRRLQMSPERVGAIGHG